MRKWRRILKPSEVDSLVRGYRVSIKKQLRDDKGSVIDKKNWVVTAFDKKRSIKEKERVSSSETLTTPPTNQTADGVTLPPNETRFESKGTTETSTLQENGEKTTESGELFRDSETSIFYSNAQRAVENIKQNKATAEQWLAMVYE